MNTQLRVLLVEDSAADAQLLLDRIAEDGLAVTPTRVYTAADLRAALEGGGWDIALVDYTLARFDGLEAVDIVGELQPDLPVIVVSGMAGEEAAVAAMRAGAHDYLAKDNLARLVPAIERELRDTQNRVATRAAEAQLRETQLRLAAMAQHLPRVVFYETGGGREFMSENLEALIGYRPEELTRDRTLFPSLMHPDDRARCNTRVRQWHRARNPGTLVNQFRTRHRNGQYVWIEDHMVAVRPPGARPYMSGMMLDITERKAEDEDRARLTAILEATPDFVATADAEGNIRYLNGAARQALGVPPDAEPAGLTLAACHTDSARDLLLNEAIPTAVHEGTWSGTTTLRRHDGHEIPVSQVIIAHKAEDGRVECLSTIARDLTEYQLLHDQLRHAQKMEAAGRLAGAVAHDFNNLLAAIIGYSELLISDLPLDHRARGNGEEILKAAYRATTITRQLLTFSRRQAAQPAVVNVNDLVADISGIVRRLLGERVELVVQSEPDLWTTRIDPGQLEQVIVNLAMNARDAMPDGGRLVLITANLRLRASNARYPPGLRPGRYVVLTATDSGCGMGESVLERAFDPFFTTKEHGTGLGLSIVYGIVTHAGGKVSVHSQLGGGTVMKVFLPAHSAATPAPPAAPRLKSPRGRGETVLVAERDPAVRGLLDQLLTRCGYRVLAAVDEEHAMHVAKEHVGNIDLLVAETQLRGMSGPALYNRLRSDYPRLRVVYTSGAEHGEMEPELFGGNVPVVPKPFSEYALLSAVAGALAQRASGELTEDAPAAN